MTNEFLKIAQSKIDALPSNTEFDLKGLMESIWDGMPGKQAFGREFKAAVKNGQISGVTHVRLENSPRRDIYVKGLLQPADSSPHANRPKKTFKQFLAELEQLKRKEFVELFEHEVYKLIPGTRNSYREDPPNTNTHTQRHSHVYTKPKGEGRQVYAVNFDGSGHDGSSGTIIPSEHADFFRDKGYDIPSNNLLESLRFECLDVNTYVTWVLLFDDAQQNQ